MQNIPKPTVDVWIAMGERLDPKKLIPALVQYDHQKYRAQVGARKVHGSYGAQDYHMEVMMMSA